MLLTCIIDSAGERSWGWRNAFFLKNKYSKYMCLQGQQLMDLEHKLTVAKEELEKTALDKVNNSEKKITNGDTLQWWEAHKIIFSSTVPLRYNLGHL